MKSAFKVVARWGGVFMGAVIKLSPYQKRLYTATRLLSPSSMQAYSIPENVADSKPQPGRNFRGDNAHDVGGEFVITPDGVYVLSHWGTLLWLSDAPAKK
jgi:hypothetical protein